MELVKLKGEGGRLKQDQTTQIYRAQHEELNPNANKAKKSQRTRSDKI